jgi:2-polyprenyl-3-methyl-5-hydroxy-6-metoxy-1,4-benzoquinol methylase
MRTFLLPLITHQQMGWPLELSLFKRDGYEPTELYQAMGWSQRLSRAAFWPVTLPAWLERRQQTAAAAAKPDAAAKPAGRQNDPELAAHLLKRTLATLRTRTARVLGKDSQSKWSDYPATLTHYTPEQSARKREWVSHALTGLKPARVLDIGANTGEYSALAASLGAEVIALERDAAAAERLFQMTRARELAIQTIHADLSRPTPAIGWDNRESATLLSRLEGRFDVVMMLAVIHHLVLMEQIPLPAILALVSRLTCGHLIVEWVPVEDPMYQSLMRGREDLYGSLSEADLMDACREHFSLQRRESLTNGRVLLLFAKHAPTLT